MWRAVRTFMLTSVVTLVLLMAAVVVFADRAAKAEAVRDAEATATSLTRNLVVPNLDVGVMSGDAAALARIDTAMRNRMADGSLQRVKIWSPDGTVLYSDDARLIGQVFSLSDEDAKLLGTWQSEAGVSDLSSSENLFERSNERLVEVYAGFVSSWGQPMLFEAYLSADRLDRQASSLFRTMTLVTIGTLLLFGALVLPMAVRLARRIDEGQRDRELLLQRAVTASDLERRRIAQDLHDGVVQDLAGLGYAMSAMSIRTTDPDSSAMFSHAAAIVGDDVNALRILLTDILPPNLGESGLRLAAEDLLVPLRQSGVEAVNAVPADLDIGEEAARAAYRVLRESLRNVAKHSSASRVEVHAELADGRVWLEVVDDGVGLPDGSLARADGHIGLQVLADTVADLGGSLNVAPGVSGGTVVTAYLPSST